MRRRRLFNLAAAMSLVVFVASSVLWPLSQTRSHLGFSYGNPTSQRYSLWLADGDVHVVRLAGIRVIPLSRGEFGRQVLATMPSQFPGFSVEHSQWRKFDARRVRQPGTYGEQTVVSLWLGWPFLATLPLSIWCVSAMGKRLRMWWELPAHLCRSCRYDLTGNTSGVCPECGTPVAGKARVTA